MQDIYLDKAMIITGIEIRTKNSIEFSGQGKIAKLWEEFFKYELAQKIKNKISNDIYAVYSNYESDYNGEYNYLIGYQTNREEKIDGIETRSVNLNLGRYKIFTTEKGQAYKVVPETWMKIWQEKNLHRAYKTDFEVYSEKYPDPMQLVVDIYIGQSN